MVHPTEEETPGVPAGSEAEHAKMRRHLQEQCEPLSQLLFGWAHLRLRSFALARVSAEDIVQETWMRAFAALTPDRASLPAPAALKAWLLGIARTVVLEEVRHPGTAEGRRTGSSTFLGSQFDTVTSICTRLGRDETTQRFLAFAEALPEVERQLLVRCGIEGASPEEVGPRLGLEPATAARRWHRLRGKLRESHWAERLGLEG